jgi:hypothetical protein
MIRLNRTMDGELLFTPHNPLRRPRRLRKRISRMRAWIAAFLAFGFAFSLDARADYWFKVNDASQIQYLIGSPQIYLRNLNTFDSTVLSCCYNYWIDVSTDAGKASWATLLAKMQAQQAIWIYIASQTVAGSATVAWFG